MSVRRNAANRIGLIRDCYTCGRTFTTTADSPWMRSMPDGSGKHKTRYFCCAECFQASYIHKGCYDGNAEQRRKEREAKRDTHEKNRPYYAAHAEQMRDRCRAAYWADPEAALAENAYYRKKRKLKKEAKV